MVAYDLSHLTQPDDQLVFGPVQDDEALLLFAMVRVMRLYRILEIGGLGGYSARNFLRAVGERGKVYTVDINPVASLAPNHVTLQKSCAGVTAADLDGEPLDLVFFDCHVYDAQMELFAGLRTAGTITDNTVIALHDTGLHPRPTSGTAYDVPGGWVHLWQERRMVNELHATGYDAVSLHMTSDRSSPEMPLRHGLTVMQKFRPLTISGEMTEVTRTAGRQPTPGLAEAVEESSRRAQRFQYGRHDGSVIAPTMTLDPAGTIGGYRHWNESSWKIVNGCLVFKDGNGVVMTVFDKLLPGERSAGYKLLGRFIPDRAEYRCALTTIG